MRTYLYETIAGKLIEEIRIGRWKAGEKIPSERELATRYGTTQITIAKAIALLSQRGIVTSMKCIGNFVNINDESASYFSGTDCKDNTGKMLQPFLKNGKYIKRLGIIYAWNVNIGYYTNQIILGIEEAVRKFGQGEYLPCIYSGYSAYEDLIYSEGIDCALFISPPDMRKHEIMHLNEQKFPCCIIGSSWNDETSLCCFDSDSKEAGKMLAEVLVYSGYRRIAVATRSTQLSNNRERLETFLCTLQNHGISVPPEWLMMRSEDHDMNREISHLFSDVSGIGRPDAVFAGNYYLAEDVYRIAKTFKLNLPADLGIVCCDSVGQGLLMNEYPVTTVMQPLRKMGYDATVSLLGYLRNVSGKNSTIIKYPVQFVPGALMKNKH